MGWQGTVRSIAATARAIERENQKVRDQAVKAQIAADAYQVVEDQNSYINSLVSVHMDLAKSVDWDQIASSPKPIEPQPSSER